MLYLHDCFSFSIFHFQLSIFRYIKILTHEKLGLLLVACLAFATISVAQNNIVKSLERNVPGQGKVTIHQDARIAALIGSEYVPAGSDEQKVIKSSGYRIQVYAGNNTRQAKNEAYAVATRIKEHFPELTVYTSFNPPVGCAVQEISAVSKKRMP